MLLPVAFLPLAAVLIQDVKTENIAGAVTIDVETSEPVAHEGVHVVPAGAHHLYLYLDKTSTGRNTFGDGANTIVVYPRARYTKLEIPAPGRCADPVSVETTPTGIRVRPTCDEKAAVARAVAAPAHQHSGSAALPVHEQIAGPAERPTPLVPRTALERNKAGGQSLRAALALPPEFVAAEKAAEVASADPGYHVTDEVVAKPGEKSAAPAVAKGSAQPAKAVADQPVAPAEVSVKSLLPQAAQPDAPAAAIANVESSAAPPVGGSGEGGKSSSSAASTVLAGMLLLGLGIAAALYARRHAKRNRMIHIVETASIGSRRSLVVASIGGRTMVLGVSEAGVALLDAQNAPSVPSEALASASSSPPADPAFSLRELLSGGGLDKETKPDSAQHEGSLLSRLFEGAKRPSEATRRSREFNELLAESLEDQELRRKLALGEGGRVA